jgi:glucosylceramidase
VRVATNSAGNLYNGAFKSPDGKNVLIVENDGANSQLFNIKLNGRWVTTSLDGGSVGTFYW